MKFLIGMCMFVIMFKVVGAMASPSDLDSISNATKVGNAATKKNQAIELVLGAK